MLKEKLVNNERRIQAIGNDVMKTIANVVNDADDGKPNAVFLKNQVFS